ncbi:hypothetical protein F3Y22_tig00110151pilonHSYRG00173 [Hibiscus syriacus]|uniref:DWD hypersensitive to UV-B 1 N-terminal domain-containing protein n=1 Tax=Hibiscus syriacus TaxID=106335 RepID=A0A6A3BMJ7_HIBSY|nr:hypothetical protein F3Y22_tig00110151pilonHSYRG00173 [Hibiscus syriacus]
MLSAAPFLFQVSSEYEIEDVDVLNESSCALSVEYALLLMRSIGQKLRIVDLQDYQLGKTSCGIIGSCRVYYSILV